MKSNKHKRNILTIFFACGILFPANAQRFPKAILSGDYPDLTVLRDGDDFYMTDLHIYGKETGYRSTKWKRDEKYGWGNNCGCVLVKSFDLIHWTGRQNETSKCFTSEAKSGTCFYR
jgi:hypothetical protein